VKRPAPQGCGACGEPVPWVRGRRSGLTWWHDADVCRAERVRLVARRRAERQAEGARQRLAPAATTAARAVAAVRRHVTDPAEAAEVLAMLGLAAA
jgi:hypothetical protein